MSRHLPTFLGAVLATMTLTACAGGGSDDVGDSSAPKGSLAAVCPANVVIQTDWYATPERAAAYQLIGAGGKVDVDKGAYVGEIGDTGVKAEVRLGGPFIGGQPVTAQMYTDTSITMGLVATDVAVRDHQKFPTKAVVSTLVKSPQILMWDPEKFDVSSWEDVKDTKAPVLFSQGVSYVDYLVHAGLVSKDQLDGSFDGSPSRFVAEEGAIFQQGYVSNEPYRWENDVEEWSKPVKSLLIDDAGYHVYPQAFTVRAAEEKKLAPCLKQLVPMIQQSELDYIDDPEATNAALLDIAAEIKDGPPMTAAGNANSVAVQIEKGIVANSPDGTLGSFDLERVDTLITTLREVFAANGKEVAADLDASSIVTNDYIDPSIHR